MNNILYYVEHFPFLTKIGMHNKGFYTGSEVDALKECGKHIFRKAKVVATCKGKVCEVRRKSGFATSTLGKYGVGVESVE